MECVAEASGRCAVWPVFAVAVLALLPGLVRAGTVSSTGATWRKLLDPDAGVFVVAHRGCHNAAPERGLVAVPENSLAALENCVALGIDMMETDVRRSRDGVLIIMHDETVDRTTNGTGRVSSLTSYEIKELHLRQNMGGSQAPIVWSQKPLTLVELLAAAKDRILLNLDVKEEIYPEVVDVVVHTGMADQIVIKRVVSPGMVALADATPYEQVLFMPVVDGKGGAVLPPTALGAVVETQASGIRRIPAVEMLSLNDAQFASVRTAARAHHLRIWTNMLTSVGVLGIIGHGGDRDALRDPQRVWGGLIGMGVSVFQTDEPAALLGYLRTIQLHRANGS